MVKVQIILENILPVKLVYFEKFERIDKAFKREKQIQGWSRKKKQALINGHLEELHHLAECQNESHFKNFATENSVFDSAQAPFSELNSKNK